MACEDVLDAACARCWRTASCATSNWVFVVVCLTKKSDERYPNYIFCLTKMDSVLYWQLWRVGPIMQLVDLTLEWQGYVRAWVVSYSSSVLFEGRMLLPPLLLAQILNKPDRNSVDILIFKNWWGAWNLVEITRVEKYLANTKNLRYAPFSGCPFKTSVNRARTLLGNVFPFTHISSIFFVFSCDQIQQIVRTVTEASL